MEVTHRIMVVNVVMEMTVDMEDGDIMVMAKQPVAIV